MISPIEFRKIALHIFNKAQESYKVKALRSSQDDIDTIANDSIKKGYEFWAVYTKDQHKPVAVAINTVVCDDSNYRGYVGYNAMKCDPNFQHNSTYPYYGLIYRMNKYYLEEKGFGYVDDGSRSLTEHSNIQSFLIDKFCFRKAYCELQVFYNPYFKLLIKILFPFRRLLKNPKILALLRQEAWLRGLE